MPEMLMDWSYVGSVVISGLVIVFVALILLIIAVWLMGKVFNAVKASPPKGKTPAAPEPKKASSPAVQDHSSNEDEVIAVIAAAVAAIAEESGTQLKIKSIKRVRTNAWAYAAANESTRSF